MFNLKSKLFAVVIAIIGIATLVGCEKEESLLTQTQSTTKSVTTIPFEDYFNNIAKEHNNALVYVGSNCSPEESSRLVRFNIVEEYTKSGIKWSDMEKLGDDLLANIESDSSITTLLVNSDYTASALVYIETLNTYFDIALDSVQAGNPLNPLEFNKKIDFLIENIVLKETIKVDTITDRANEYAMVIAGCYIAKASYEYWYNAAKFTDHAWYLYMDAHATSKLPPWVKRAWHAIKVAAVDTWSFILCHETYPDGEDGVTHYVWNVDDAVASASSASATVE